MKELWFSTDREIEKGITFLSPEYTSKEREELQLFMEQKISICGCAAICAPLCRGEKISPSIIKKMEEREVIVRRGCEVRVTKHFTHPPHHPDPDEVPLLYLKK